MSIAAINTNISDEDCEPVVGMERLLACEARAAKRIITLLLTTTDNSAIRREWQEQGIIKAAQLRAYLNTRAPYNGMRGSDRTARLDDVMELLIGDAVLAPLSSTEAIVQLGESTRNTGSFLRLLPQGLDKLARIAGEPVEPVPLGQAVTPAAAE